VILDDDFHSYVPTIVQNALRNCGQVCISPNRVLVRDGQHDAFVVALVEHLGSLKVGDPHEPETDFGPVVSQRQREKGGRIHRSSQGRRCSCSRSAAVVRPGSITVGMSCPPSSSMSTNSMEVAQEEIFGPVISVIRYRDEADAVRESPTTLRMASVERYSRRTPPMLSPSPLQIDNGHMPDQTTRPGAGGGGPFGGRKKSGLGAERQP